ncbi:titin-like [Menidia menidia]
MGGVPQLPGPPLLTLSFGTPEPAKVTEEPKSISVTQGDPALLEARFSGTAPLKARWLRAGRELSSGPRYKLQTSAGRSALRVLRAEPGDGGEYAFEVSNDVGQSSCQATLTVLDQIIPPSFTRKLRPVEAIKGSFAQLECLVSGSLPVKVSWHRDQEEIQTGPRHKCTFFENVALLEISDLSSRDGGSYSCVAQNSAGSAQCAASLFVKEPPLILEKPESMNVLPGSKVQFSVLVSGSPPLTIKWFKNGKEVVPGADCSVAKDSSSSLLELLFAKSSDCGEYVCEVQNPVGSASCRAALFVKEPPKFTRTPARLSVVRSGQSKVFECQVTGTPEIDVYWFKDGSELCAGERHRLAFANAVASLEVCGAEARDGGLYYCEARNEAGSESCSMELRVKEPPSFISEAPPADVVQGSSAVFQCQVSGTGPFELTWHKDGKELRPSAKHVLTQAGAAVGLQVNRCEPADAGEYLCTVANEVGSCTCKTRLSLKEPPAFSSPLQNCLTAVGRPAQLQCAVLGSPTLTVQWQKDDRWIPEDPKIQRTFENNVATLRIPACEAAHAGTYACQVLNEAGQDKCQATLTVQEPPEITEKPELVRVSVGDPVSLDCRVRGSPELRVSWTKDGRALAAAGRIRTQLQAGVASLRIPAAQQDDQGDYELRAENHIGSCSCSVRLLVLGLCGPITLTLTVLT